MGHLAGPGHFRDMYQPFDAAFELDECAVIHQTDHLTLHTCADGILFRHRMPRIGRELFHAQGNTFFFGIELEHNDFDFFTHLNDFGGMVDASPGHIADVENAINAAEIDEGAVAGNIFDC